VPELVQVDVFGQQLNSYNDDDNVVRHFQTEIFRCELA
jgi:hypothetical protein